VTAGFAFETGRPIAEIAPELVPGGGMVGNWANEPNQGHPESKKAIHHLAQILGEPHDSPRFERGIVQAARNPDEMAGWGCRVIPPQPTPCMTAWVARLGRCGWLPGLARGLPAEQL
jgi:hypothetical protein